MSRTGASKTTTNHDEIRKWVEKNGGCPARVKATGRGKDDPGILRIDYPGFSGKDSLVKMDWDAWFEAFDANGLAFIYQPSTRFSKLVARGVKRGARGTARRSATAGRRTGAKKSTAKRTARRGSSSSTAKKRASTRPTKRTTRATAKRASKRGSSRSKA